MLAFSFCLIADGVHTLLYGNRWPCFVYYIPVDFLGNFLLFQVSVSYRHSLFFPWGISTKWNLGRHHGSEKQLFWVSFYIILVEKSEHRLLSLLGPLPVVCSQDHAIMLSGLVWKCSPWGNDATRDTVRPFIYLLPYVPWRACPELARHSDCMGQWLGAPSSWRTGLLASEAEGLSYSSE